MNPFVPILCPVCHQKLLRDETEYEFTFRCPDEGQPEGNDSCAHITYDKHWNFKDITYFQKAELLIQVTIHSIHITEHGRYPYKHLDLLNFKPVMDMVETLMVFM